MSSISVVIPTFNASPFIRATLASVFTQTRLPDEVIIVDDCSRDDTIRVVDEIAHNAPVPVKLIRLSTNSGSPAIPLTVGFDNARGDYLSALDQDDILLPNKFQRQSALLDEYSDVSYAFGACAHLSSSGQICHREVFDTLGKPGECGVVSGEHMLDLLLSNGQFLIGFPGFIIRRSSWAHVRPLNSSLRITNDYDLLCRLSRFGRVGFVHEVHYFWRSHSGNMTKQNLRTGLETIWILERELQLLRQQLSLSRARSSTEEFLIRRVRGNLSKELLDVCYSHRRNGDSWLALGACVKAIRFGAVGKGLIEGLKVTLSAVRNNVGKLKRQSPPMQSTHS